MMSLNEYLQGDVLQLIDEYMPDRGEGENQASQACTAVNKLIYKWYNDGDVYDNTYYLKGWCNDLSSYANWLHNHNLDSGILDRIRKIHSENEYEELLADLANEVITKKNLEELEKLPVEGSIYSESGPCKFEEDYEDEYDDEYDDEW